ncbi:MAG: rhomboid family intramembrane serine protease [Elusimicrobiota bacterium]
MIPFPYLDENPHPSRKNVVIALIVLNACAMPWWTKAGVMTYGFIPADPEPYRWITSMFLHGGFMHLVANMWFLWIFGDNVEGRMGRGFLPFYLASGIAAAYMHYAARMGSHIPMIGASGAVSGVIGAYLVLFPSARLRCFIWLIYKPYFFSMSALVFGALYIGWQTFMIWLTDGKAGVAYGAHLGGALFGVIAGSVLRILDPVDEPVELAEEASRPVIPESAGRERDNIEAAVRAERLDTAISGYVRAVRRDPYFALSEKCQLWMGDKLARSGRPHLARNALEKFVLRNPLNPHSAHALLLMGVVESEHYHDFAAAARSYEKALAHPKVSEDVKTSAQKRLEEARRRLMRTAQAANIEGERYWIILESSARLSARDLRNIAFVVGAAPDTVRRRLDAVPGVVANGLGHGPASALAERLERLRVPVALRAQRSILPLPKAVLMTGLIPDDEGLRLTGPEDAKGGVRWKDALLVAGVGVRMEGKVLPMIEILATNPSRRFRWVPSPDLRVRPEDEANYFDVLQEVVLRAKGVPVNRGAQAAFRRELPAAVVHQDTKRLHGYMAWQMQLALLRRGGGA